MKFILLNGPAHSGKDTAAKAICIADPFHTTHEKLANPIRKALAGVFGEWAFREEMKSETIPGLSITGRQWMIDFSETFMVPRYGEDIFVRLLFERIEDEGVCVVSDCGFQREYGAILGRTRRQNVLLVQIHRPGYSFVGDSREYVTLPIPPTSIEPRSRFELITNDGTIEMFQQKVLALVQDFLE